jgi:hypothetical protein
MLLLFTSAPSFAQSMMDERRLGRSLPAFADDAPAPTLRCSISAIPPQLNYSFRFQAGYVVTIPMNQFEGSGHRWRMITRITPDQPGARPSYLVTGFALPTVPPTKIELQVGGGYLLGEGTYRVRHVLLDETGRTCRRDWNVDVHRGRSEGKVRVAMLPGSVLDVSLRGATATAPPIPDDARPLRLTILLHAAPMSPRRMRLRPNDMLTLLASVTAVLEHVPATSVRLVAFNLEQQREMFRKDGFGLSDLSAVADAMTSVELGMVDVKVLQNRRGHLETITSLVNAELAADSPSDAVIFLGPTSRFDEKPPAESVKKIAGAPQFLFFQLAPIVRGGRGGGGRGPGGPGLAPPMLEPTLPDSIRHTVSRLGGKTYTIRTPGELAKAIDRLEQTAPHPHAGLPNE